MQSTFARGVATLAVVASLLLAGCTGVLVERTSAPAALPDDARATAGYDAGVVAAVPFTVPVAVGPVVRDVRVTGHLATYADDEGAAVFLLSTPNEAVAGQSVNPVVYAADPAAVTAVLDAVRDSETVTDVSATEFGDLRPVASRERTLLGTRTPVTTYAATAVAENGSETAVLVHVAVVEHDGDVILAVGVHDADRDAGPTIHGLFERIAHPADVAVTTPPRAPGA